MNAAEFKSLWQMMKGMPAGATHAARLDAFYRPQVEHYDELRKRMLHGRDTLLDFLDLPAGASVVELGAGTGAMLDLWGARTSRLSRLELVDICPALLERARRRALLFDNVRVTEADAVTYRPPQPVDCVYFSYALTMIPDWLGALANALAMLKPGGVLGVVDFYVAGTGDTWAMEKHASMERWFWTRWFAHDQVRLSRAHLAALCATTDRLRQFEGRGPLPWLPCMRVPYYAFAGVRPSRLRTDVIAHLRQQGRLYP